MSPPTKVPPNVLAALGLLGGVGCDTQDSNEVDADERSTKSRDKNGEERHGIEEEKVDEPDGSPLPPGLTIEPVGPGLDLIPGTGLKGPRGSETKGPRLGPCLKIAFDDDASLRRPVTTPAGGDGVNSTFDLVPDFVPPPMDVCLSIAPPPGGPLKQDSQPCLSEIPDDSQGRHVTPEIRDSALVRVLDSGVLPPDVAERVEDFS